MAVIIPITIPHVPASPRPTAREEAQVALRLLEPHAPDRERLQQ